MKTPTTLAALALAALLAGACSNAEDASQGASTGPAASSQQDLPDPEAAGLISHEEAAQEAQEITPENADSELEKLQSEVGG